MDLEEPDPSSSSSSSATLIANGSSSSSASGPSISQVQEEENNRPENENQNQQTSHVNNSLSEAPVSEIRDDVWSCLIVLVSFWFFASTTVILCFYGSSNLQLGPNCSRLIQTVPFFVESIKVEELEEAKPGPMLYGFDKPPPLDVEITWTETHKTFVPVDFHKEWSYFLNKGSRIDVMVHTKSPSSPPLVLVIAKGKESMIEWIDSSYPNTTLSWNIIHGSGKIHQEIPECSSYYIALGNLNSEDVEVELEFTIKALLYNTTKAYYKCSLGNRLCSLKLSLLGAKTAVLTSPPHDEYSPAGDDWYVKLSYGPRWFTYFIGSGLMTMIILLAFRFCNKLQNGVVHRGEPERAPLLFPKDDNNSSCGSSYDSLSHEEEDQEEWQAPESSLEAKAAINEGENNNNIINARRLCVICFDSPRDCFFLPCGHCASCLTCGTRIAEETGVCPICRRKMKKVRKIFTV